MVRFFYPQILLYYHCRFFQLRGFAPIKYTKLILLFVVLALFSTCKEEPTKVTKEEQFRTVYGIVRTLENSQIAGQIGDISKNS